MRLPGETAAVHGHKRCVHQRTLKVLSSSAAVGTGQAAGQDVIWNTDWVCHTFFHDTCLEYISTLGICLSRALTYYASISIIAHIYPASCTLDLAPASVTTGAASSVAAEAKDSVGAATSRHHRCHSGQASQRSTTGVLACRSCQLPTTAAAGATTTSRSSICSPSRCVPKHSVHAHQASHVQQYPDAHCTCTAPLQVAAQTHTQGNHIHKARS